MKFGRMAKLPAVALFAALLAGCSPLYLLQAGAGQMEMIRKRRPIAAVIANPETPAELRRKLKLAVEALAFAHTTLLLPDNGAYRHYTDLRRQYAVWNVFAAPEFSLELRQWCFLLVGCVAYRGYFAESAAREYAADLARRGDDVFVSGAVAYSTLGYFADPLPSTVTMLADAELVGLIFHELAHQLAYLRDDTVFNESFASFVEAEGLRRWYALRGDQAGACALQVRLERREALRRLLGSSRERLMRIYGESRSDAEKRAAKNAEFVRLSAEYRRLREAWSTPPYFDHWFSTSLNNASLGALAAYDDLMPAFSALLRQEAGLLLAFYARVRDLLRLAPEQRTAVLAALRTEGQRYPAGLGAGRMAPCRDSPDLQ